eukprot:Unigene1737_Nuclearia_a/m.5337 Unigene1737_Nuclearia_a/g.5337  ORF Unigene1737_Nuclearia_a/g.5337 Unigene1737_Nuclearia_a/m.5337 type:complete len:391 (+) Unigene1737_Nuclearia_a:3368-4540(+)
MLRIVRSVSSFRSISGGPSSAADETRSSWPTVTKAPSFDRRSRRSDRAVGSVETAPGGRLTVTACMKTSNGTRSTSGKSRYQSARQYMWRMTLCGPATASATWLSRIMRSSRDDVASSRLSSDMSTLRRSARRTTCSSAIIARISKRSTSSAMKLTGGSLGSRPISWPSLMRPASYTCSRSVSMAAKGTRERKPGRENWRTRSATLPTRMSRFCTCLGASDAWLSLGSMLVASHRSTARPATYRLLRFMMRACTAFSHRRWAAERISANVGLAKPLARICWIEFSSTVGCCGVGRPPPMRSTSCARSSASRWLKRAAPHSSSSAACTAVFIERISFMNASTDMVSSGFCGGSLESCVSVVWRSRLRSQSLSTAEPLSATDMVFVRDLGWT